MVLLSASVETFSVPCMRDFLTPPGICGFETSRSWPYSESSNKKVIFFVSIRSIMSMKAQRRNIRVLLLLSIKTIITKLYYFAQGQKRPRLNAEALHQTF